MICCTTTVGRPTAWARLPSSSAVRGKDWLYLGISLTAAGTGLVLPVIAYLAASVSRQKLGSTMGAVAASAGLGQTLGASLTGWLFAATAQLTFGLLMLPLVVMLVVLAVRPGWWSPRQPPDTVNRNS